MSRLQITIEFSKADISEIEAFVKLKAIGHPGSLIKDALMGRIPFELIKAIIEKN